MVRKRPVEHGNIAGDEVRHGKIAGHQILEEGPRLLHHALAENVPVFRIHASVGLRIVELAEVEPLLEKPRHEAVEPRIGNHPVDLGGELCRLVEAAASRGRQKLLVGQRIPEPERKPRGEALWCEPAVRREAVVGVVAAAGEPWCIHKQKIVRAEHRLVGVDHGVFETVASGDPRGGKPGILPHLVVGHVAAEGLRHEAGEQAGGVGLRIARGDRHQRRRRVFLREFPIRWKGMTDDLLHRLAVRRPPTRLGIEGHDRHVAKQPTMALGRPRFMQRPLNLQPVDGDAGAYIGRRAPLLLRDPAADPLAEAGERAHLEEQLLVGLHPAGDVVHPRLDRRGVEHAERPRGTLRKPRARLRQPEREHEAFRAGRRLDAALVPQEAPGRHPHPVATGMHRREMQRETPVAVDRSGEHAHRALVVPQLEGIDDLAPGLTFRTFEGIPLGIGQG